MLYLLHGCIVVPIPSGDYGCRAERLSSLPLLTAIPLFSTNPTSCRTLRLHFAGESKASDENFIALQIHEA